MVSVVDILLLVTPRHIVTRDVEPWKNQWCAIDIASRILLWGLIPYAFETWARFCHPDTCGRCCHWSLPTTIQKYSCIRIILWLFYYASHRVGNRNSFMWLFYHTSQRVGNGNSFIRWDINTSFFLSVCFLFFSPHKWYYKIGKEYEGILREDL